MANISIKEGGIAKQFGHVNKLKISNEGGGTSLWVPEDAVNTKNLYVTKNGDYYASKDKDKPYGYDEIDVNITNEAYGYDDDGGFYDIGVDDDGFLEEPEEVPDHITITVPPTKTRYMAYEPIDTAGMVVVAYYADGTEYGEIPREEYSINPIVAIPSSNIDAPDKGQYFDAYGHHFTVARIHVGSVLIGNLENSVGTRTYTLTQADEDVYIYRYPEYAPSGGLQYEDIEYISTGKFTLHYAGPTGVGEGWSEYDRVRTVDYDRARYSHQGLIGRNTWVPQNDPTDSVARTKINNDIVAFENAGELEDSSTISVLWNIPDTSIELADTFRIEVEEIPVPQVSGDGDSSGGSSGGSW